MTTEVLATHTPELFQLAVERAAALLRAGQLVALPTETVYGLAANALDATAVSRIYEVKGRPSHNPIIVHVADDATARSCVQQWPAIAGELARAFWPGPLTLVLPRAEKIPALVTAGGDTVGIRWPAHPLMQAVIRACGFPLAAPSANLSNQISPTNAAHVLAQLGGKIPLIVDGGQSQVGIESTVLDLTVSPARILRPGMIHADSLAAAAGRIAAGPAAAGSGSLKSPGMLKKHYAPKARLLVLSWRDEADLRAQLGRRDSVDGRVQIVAHTRIPAGFAAANVSVIPHDAPAFARALYAALHRCDAAGAQTIVVEAPPEAPEWAGIADRLRRAAA
jgi:L-threonylcarbamoyladenylate synthase